jgi:nucleoside-diphosphate-sugar epimerase
VDWLQGDLLDPSALARLVPEGGVVYHLGASLHGTTEAINASIVHGTDNILSIARQQGARVVHVSSLSVLDPVATAALRRRDESCPIDSQPEVRGAYAQAKIEAEQLATNAYRAGGDVRIVRPAQIVGPSLGAVPPSVAIASGPLLLALAPMREPLPVVHVLDASAGLVLIGSARDSGEVVHLVDPLRVTRAELLRAFRRDRVAGADRPLVRASAAGSVLTTLCRAVGAHGRYRRMLALRARARWSCDAATRLGWTPKHLGPWIEGG